MIAVMYAIKTLQPPGGATALIAVIGSDTIHNLGFFYVLLLSVAFLVHNIPRCRRYPEI